jgi:TonB family protein
MKKRPTYQPVELLRQWLRGDARYKDEQQLDQLAADDPFLADALEGLRRLPEGGHEQRVASLKARVRAYSREKRSGWFYLPRIAAAVAAVVLLAVGLWYLNPGQRSAPELAMNSADEAALTPAKSEKLPAASGPQSISGESAAPSASERAAAPSRSGPADYPVPKPQVPQFAEEAPPHDLNDALPIQEISPAAAAKPSPSAPALPPPAPLTARQLDLAATTPPSPTNLVTGRITDETGNPLFGATILLPGTNRGTVTDFYGNFQLPLDNEGQQPLEVSYTGYAPARLSAKAGDSIEVQLSHQEMAMQEVTVIADKKMMPKRTRAAETAPAKALTAPSPSPSPLDGFKPLDDYLRRSLQYPAAALENGIEGPVELDFLIAPDGQPTDFKVLRSPGYGCSEEAIRLLREGPKWGPAGQRAQYVVEFKL